MATDVEILHALNSHQGSRKYAARAIGISERRIAARIAKMKAKGIEVPESQYRPGQRTLYKGTPDDGEVLLTWVKTPMGRATEESVREALNAMAEKLPREKPLSPPRKSLPEELLNVYVITDFHLGMKAWHEEAGDDWDTSIAENLLIRWFETAIKRAPDAQTGVYAQLGDFLHWDGLEAVTPTNQHVLDADTRFQKVVRVAIRATRRIIGMLLKKHQNVHIIMAEGNHDPASSIWLREWLSAVYEDEPRVTVDLRSDTYYAYEFGKVGLFFHHGHKQTPKTVDDVLVSKFRDVFGRTSKCYAHLGHKHHDWMETKLMKVEQHRTLASKDAYAARGGWQSDRDAKVITYHRDFGEVVRNTIPPEMAA